MVIEVVEMTGRDFLVVPYFPPPTFFGKCVYVFVYVCKTMHKKAVQKYFKADFSIKNTLYPLQIKVLTTGYLANYSYRLGGISRGCSRYTCPCKSDLLCD